MAEEIDPVKAFRESLGEQEMEAPEVTEGAQERMLGVVSSMLQKGEIVEITKEIKELGLEGKVRQMLAEHEARYRFAALHRRGDDDFEDPYDKSTRFGI